MSNPFLTLFQSFSEFLLKLISELIKSSVLVFIMAASCHKCSSRQNFYLGSHDCLHLSQCVIPEVDPTPTPKSVRWQPSNCLVCSSWVTELRADNISDVNSKALRSFISDIRMRRSKSKVPSSRLWNFFPDDGLASLVSKFYDSECELCILFHNYCWNLRASIDL